MLLIVTPVAPATGLDWAAIMPVVLIGPAAFATGWTVLGLAVVREDGRPVTDRPGTV